MTSADNTTTQRSEKTSPSHAFPIIGVGASAGGLEAFKNFLTAMPKGSGMACVLIQHLDPTHESMMVELLSHHTEMKVFQAENDIEVKPNTVYMIPPDRDMTLSGNTLRLTTPTERRGKRLPIDRFFCSLAEAKKEKAICVVLSGTGSDGTQGLKEVKRAGGLAIAQSPKDAQFDGMPVSAISTGLVDYVLPAEQIPEVLVGYVRHPYVTGGYGVGEAERESSGGLYSVLSILQSKLGYNFHHYKRNTLIRRIVRRMGLKQIEEMNQYAELLRNDPDEATELFRDMLIGVTSFFREKSSWDVLEKRVIPAILDAKESGDSIRVWVAGCSTGEEAYSMGMLFLEAIQEAESRVSLQIFASDIDTAALERARAGRYTASEVAGVPSKLLKLYFTEDNEYYTISSRLRDRVVFSEQNLISDPPFSKIDVVSCRNLLIYLQNDIQERVIEMFHFSLNPGGFLFLGNSESIGQGNPMFRCVSKRWRIFSKMDTIQTRRANFPILQDNRGDRLMFSQSSEPHPPPPVKINALAREAIVNELSYTVVIINGKGEMLYQLGQIEKYLHFPGGVPSLQLFDLCRDGLVTRLRGAVHKCFKDGTKVLVNGARVKREKRYYPVSLIVTPLDHYTGGAGLAMVCFEDESEKKAHKTSAVTLSNNDDSPLIKQLEYELSTTKEDLQNTIEELETSNEELKASNEEVMSMNEELQSSNEELETSKEELQSLNEELNTVNNELQEKVASLESTNNDLTNLMNNTDVASVFLDSDMHVKFFTPATTRLFALIQNDIGRDIRDITRRFDDPALLSDAQQVVETLRPKETKVVTESGENLLRKIMPYRTQDNRIEGVVITFVVLNGN